MKPSKFQGEFTCVVSCNAAEQIRDCFERFHKQADAAKLLRECCDAIIEARTKLLTHLLSAWVYKHRTMPTIYTAAGGAATWLECSGEPWRDEFRALLTGRNDLPDEWWVKTPERAEIAVTFKHLSVFVVVREREIG